MRSVADYRQLNDALFHAGTRSGSTDEWEDLPNRLHFYIVNVHHDGRGILSYTLGVRSLDGAGPQTRGVSLTSGPVEDANGPRFAVVVTLTNTGRSAATPANAHPRDASAYQDSDIYRITATVDGSGWAADLQNALAAIRFGASQSVPVFVRHTTGASDRAVVTVTARSESDPTKLAVVKVPVSR